MSRAPLVSVIIPTYNCAQYIVEAIESVLGQTYENWEIIVVDDGSTDDTRDALGAYLERITYVYQENRGLSCARNVGIGGARGQLIAFLDADDHWFPEKLDLQVKAFREYPDARLFFTDSLVFEDSRVVRQSGFDGRADGWLRSNGSMPSKVVGGDLYPELLEQNYVHVSMVMLRSDVLEEVGLFDERFKISQDYDLWLRITRKYPAACVNQVLGGYRYRPESLSGPADVRDLRYDHEAIAVLEKHLQMETVPCERQHLIKEALGRRYWSQGWRYFNNNNFAEARSLFFHGIRYRPVSWRHWQYLAACFLPLAIIEALRWIKRAHFLGGIGLRRT